MYVHDHEGDVNRVSFSVSLVSFTLLHNVSQCFVMFHNQTQQWQFSIIYILQHIFDGFSQCFTTSSSAVEAVKIQGRRGSWATSSARAGSGTTSSKSFKICRASTLKHGDVPIRCIIPQFFTPLKILLKHHQGADKSKSCTSCKYLESLKHIPGEMLDSGFLGRFTFSL